jgi:hypothetical protein
MSSSDIIKAYLSSQDEFGGSVKEWKRQSVTKVPDTISSIERLFNNKATGQEVKVLEITHPEDAIGVDPKSNYISKDNALYIFTETKPADRPVTFKTNIEQDSDKIEAAETVMAIILGYGCNVKKDKINQLIEESGAQAYYNQYYFALNTADFDGPVWWVVPKEHFDSNNYLFDGFLPHMPDFLEESAESMYECKHKWTDKKVASELMRLGFQYSGKFQQFCDSQHMNLISNCAVKPKDSSPKL